MEEQENDFREVWLLIYVIYFVEFNQTVSQ